MSSAEEPNKAVVLRHFDIINGGATAGWDEIMAEDFAAHHPTAPGVGRDRYRNAFAGYAGVFSEFRTEIHRLVAEGDLVVAHTTSRGRHTGEFLGVAPSGRDFAFSAISIYRIVEGRLAEAWYAEDTLGLFQQLGVLPPDIGRFREFWSTA
jgi:predicted ester cyclase